jgi:hypothetical protein
MLVRFFIRIIKFECYSQNSDDMHLANYATWATITSAFCYALCGLLTICMVAASPATNQEVSMPNNFTKIYI